MITIDLDQYFYYIAYWATAGSSRPHSPLHPQNTFPIFSIVHFSPYRQSASRCRFRRDNSLTPMLEAMARTSR